MTLNWPSWLLLCELYVRSLLSENSCETVKHFNVPLKCVWCWIRVFFTFKSWLLLHVYMLNIILGAGAPAGAPAGAVVAGPAGPAPCSPAGLLCSDHTDWLACTVLPEHLSPSRRSFCPPFKAWKLALFVQPGTHIKSSQPPILHGTQTLTQNLEKPEMRAD